MEQLNITVDKEQWKVKRVDVSYNFRVNNVEAYMNEIAKRVISKRTKIIYNENETIIFKNKSSSICFYDKEKECISNKEKQEIIEAAKGVLRLEIRPAIYHLKDYSINRKAVDLLTKNFFIYIIEKFRVNEFLSLQNQLNANEVIKALNVMKVSDIEKVLGFNMIVEIIGEKTLLEKRYYKSGTLRNRKELLGYFNRDIRNYNQKQKQLHIPVD